MKCPYLNQNMFFPYEDYRDKFNDRAVMADPPLTVTTASITNANDKIAENIQIPVFHGGVNPRILQYINKNINDDIIEFKEQMETEAVEYAEKLKKKGKPPDPYKISTTYSVTYNKNNILSVSLFFQEYISGRNSYIRTTYNYDLFTGESMPLKSLFRPGTDYMAVLNRRAMEYLQTYSPGSLPQFKGIKDDQPYYIDNTYLVLFPAFNEIAGTAAGIPVIRIYLKSLSAVIKPTLLQ